MDTTEVSSEPDIVLVSGRKRFFCHRDRLAKYSPYFQAMFSSSMIESKADEVQLKGITASSLKLLVDYVYSNKFQANENNVYSALEAAAMFQFDSIKDACVEFLLSSLSIKNCLSIMCAADSLCLVDLLRPSRQIALWEFSSVAKGKEIKQLEVAGLEAYLSNDGLRVKSEVEVYECIERWVRSDSKKRYQYLMQLIKTLRFQDMSTSEMNELLRRESVREDPECVELLRAIKTQKSNGNKSTSIPHLDDVHRLAVDLLKPNRRCIPLVPTVLGHLFCAEDERSGEPDIAYLDVKRRLLVRLGGLSKVTGNGQVATGFRACVVGQRIYVMGGEFQLGYSNWNDAMWSYNTFLSSWTFESNLPQPRRHHSVCVLDDDIYLIGGIGTYRLILNRMDRYNTVTGSWSTVQPLPIATYSAACTAHDGKIYVLLSLVYCLDPKANTWTTMRRTELPMEKGFHSAMSHYDGIYLLGHHSQDLVLYYTRCGDRTEGKKAYTIVGRFAHPSSNACLVDNVIYSFSSEGKCGVVETYDLFSKTFSVITNDDGKNLFQPVHLHYGCFALPLYEL